MAFRNMLVLCLFAVLGLCRLTKAQSQRDCTFDNGMCGFVNDQSGTDDFNWIKMRGAAESVTKFRTTRTLTFIRHPFRPFDHHRGPFGFWHHHRPQSIYVPRKVSYQVFPRGPRRDHTTGRGSYMYTRTRPSDVQTGNIARLISPVFTNVSCLKFFYFMHGNDIGGLEILVKIGNDAPTKVWSLFGNIANMWKSATVPIKARENETVQVYLQGVVGASGRSSVGVDDVVISSDQCTFNPAVAKPKDAITDGMGSCTFDRSSCSYRNAKDDDFDWKIAGRQSLISTLGPHRDRTTGLGKYIHAEAARRGTKARLVSPTLYNTSCVSFYYYMFGSQVGTINVYILAEGNYTRVLQRTGNQGNRWYKSEIVFGRDAVNTSYSVVFEAVNGGDFTGGIAIDDISASYNCFSLPSNPVTGPNIIPTNVPTMKVNSVRLVNGPTNYEGRVEVFHNGIWGTICDDLWDMADATVVCKMLGFPGAVRTTKSQIYGRGTGTIWLDDLKCKGSETRIDQCSHGGWGNNNCDHDGDAGVICRLDSRTSSTGDCTFEYDVCGYQNGDQTTSEFDWTRKRGPTPSSLTGPNSDQSGKGYYMYTEVSTGDTGARAKLISPPLSVNTKCVTFYYHMRGSDIGSLNVYFKRKDSTVKIWALSRDQGNLWLQGKVPINATGDEALRIIFEGVRGNSEKGDIAIDTISVSNTSCVITPTKAKPAQIINALEGAVRLVGDSNPLQGRVEIFHNGQWGTICNNMWGDEDATVVCKMLGYQGVGRSSTSLNRPRGVGPIWLDNVQCTGGESSLLQCRKNPWGRHNCAHSKDAWVVCSNGTFNDECSRYKALDTADRARTYSGGVAECDRKSGIFPGQWHRFNGKAGTKIASSCVPENRCGSRASGWLNGDHPTINEGMVTRKVCFSYLSNCCKWSTLIRVKNCSGFYVYELQKPPSCNLRYCGNGPDVLTPRPTLQPTPRPQPTPDPRGIRLAGGKNDYSGRVEVYHNGRWGTVCDDQWDLNDAKVACRMLGFPDAFKAHNRGSFGQGVGQIWLDELACTGNEKDLGTCSHNAWGNNDCGHREDAGVTCVSEKMYSCDFERDLCLFTTTNLNNGLVWVRQQATYPAYDHTFGLSGKPACSIGWSSMYKGNCYSLNNHETRITWHDAEKKCRTKNAWLVDIRDTDEWNFVRKLPLSSALWQYFIGLREENGSGVWKYLDGKVMNLPELWMTGEPSNADGKEDCGALFTAPSNVGRFNDLPCDKTWNTVSYICKTNQQRRVLGDFLRLKSPFRYQPPQASLVSPIITANFTCLTFYFYMFGTNVDSLRVIFRSQSPKKDIIVWHLEGSYSNGNGSHSKEWNKAQIPLNSMNSGKYKIVFQAARLGGSHVNDGEIAIDDINTTKLIPSHLCSFSPQRAQPLSWATAMNGSCNFGNGRCGYTNDKTGLDYTDWSDDLSMQKGNNKMSTPLYDHTTYSYNTGSYMYMQYTIGQSTGQSARLISPSLSPSQAKCLSFYMHFNKKSTFYQSDMELTVSVRPTRHTSILNENPVWRLTYKTAQDLGYWYKGVVPLMQKTDFQVIFEGLLNGNGLIAVDDILISSSSECYLAPNEAYRPSVPTTGKVIRLASSTTNGTGRVEVYYRGRWGTVCGNVWTLNNAHVVCRQLGYEGALSASCCGLFGGGTGRIWLNDVSCSGKESSLQFCPHKGWGNNQCRHNQDAGVVCKTASRSEVQVRLNGTSTSYKGRVEVKYIGIWGTIDDNGWDILDATVVCRQLGFAGAISAFTGSTFGKGQGPVWFSKVHCHGNESTLSQCIDYNSKSANQYHRNDAGVECFGARLVGDTKPNAGRVEIQYRGKWGAICGTNWNMNAAHVICRNLGYKRAKSTSLLDKGSEDVLLDQVKCKGDEASIMFCLHLGLNIHRCDSSKVVGVECMKDKITQEVDPCLSNPCKNNGKCSVTKNTFSCRCSRNFTDETCQTFIGNSIVGILLKGDVNKWNPLQFRSSVANILNKYCSDCNQRRIRSKRETTTNYWQIFKSNDVIIIEDPFSRPSHGFLFVEFVVVRKMYGKQYIVDSAKLRQAITKGGRDGIAGYDVIEIQEERNGIPDKVSTLLGPPLPHSKARSNDESSNAFKIGFVVVLTLMLLMVIILAVIRITRSRMRRHQLANNYQLQTIKGSKTDNETLLNENGNPFL